MNVFDTHKQIVADYAQYIRSFINISDSEIASTVEASLSEGRLWPQPLLQFNPAYEQAGTVDEVIASRLLHDDVRHIFDGYSLYRHQREAIELGVAGTDFVVTSGTGSGKSLNWAGRHRLPHGDRFRQVTDLHRHLQSPARQSGHCGGGRHHRLSDERADQLAEQRIQHLQGQLREEHRAHVSHSLRPVHRPGKGRPAASHARRPAARPPHQLHDA